MKLNTQQREQKRMIEATNWHLTMRRVRQHIRTVRTEVFGQPTNVWITTSTVRVPVMTPAQYRDYKMAQRAAHQQRMRRDKQVRV